MLVFRHLLKVFKDRCVQQSSGEKYELSLIRAYCAHITETDGSGQLNISMQHLATSFDLVLKIFINAPTAAA